MCLNHLRFSSWWWKHEEQRAGAQLEDKKNSSNQGSGPSLLHWWQKSCHQNASAVRQNNHKTVTLQGHQGSRGDVATIKKQTKIQRTKVLQSCVGVVCWVFFSFWKSENFQWFVSVGQYLKKTFDARIILFVLCLFICIAHMLFQSNPLFSDNDFCFINFFKSSKFKQWLEQKTGKPVFDIKSLEVWRLNQTEVQTFPLN